MNDSAPPALQPMPAPGAVGGGDASAPCAVLYVGARPEAVQEYEDADCRLFHAPLTGAALAALSGRGIDVIACDLRDAPADKLAFLEAARRGWPEITRLALGPGDDSALVIAAVNRGGIGAYVNMDEPAHGVNLRELMRTARQRKLRISSHGQLKQLEALRESTCLLDAIIDNLPVSVQIKSVQDDLRVIKWNKAAESLFGLPREEALGRNVHDLWPAEDADRMHASDLELIADGGTREYRDRAAQTRHRGTIRVHMRKVPLYENGVPTHLLVIADDITAHLSAEAALLEAQARFQRALAGSQDGLWEYNLRDGSVFMSERLRSMLGVGPQDLPKQHDTTSHLVHPDDLASYRQAYADLLKRGETLQWEGRFRLPDGSYRWFRVRGVATIGADGRAVLASGTTTDIDAARRAQDELRRHRDDLAGLVRERTAGLTQAMRAAERANHAKSEFLANMSHELRWICTK